MGATVDERFKIKSLNPVFIVAGNAVFHGEFPDNFFGIFRLGMEAARPVAGFASGIFYFRGFRLGDKTALLFVACGMTFKTGLIFFGSELCLHFFDTVKGMCFFRVFHKSIILLFMAVFAALDRKSVV